MKTLKKYAGVLMMLTLLVSFTSCEDDETIFDRIVGRTWIGDLGFYVNGEPVESGITFKSNGFGVDEQFYYDWGDRAAVLDVRWWIDHGDLYLDYGNRYPLLVLEAVYVDGRYLTGRLYSGNIDQGIVTLEMVD
ncbi:hypothetical protein [Bacteroides sp.]|uniref:hypothetical protein n=1 Tax=Bacteroides sp. TaxID=29523 RepID=UPI002602EF2E|nr:hypothetical protein [Bacteroides sp.]MDD3037167.1 hypothetical protein [Bacteroides sp.]